MKVLVVSFDKTLTDDLREALKDFEVIVVKNGEEAINTVFPDVDIVIYDAISGAISESDINKMYKQKFRDAKYIILVDSLFPIDVNNIETPKKLLVDREGGIQNIVNAVTKGSLEHTYQEEIPLMQEYDFELHKEPIEETLNLSQYQIFQEETNKKGTKVLVVTFDVELIKRLSSSLGDAFNIISATNKKEILEKVPEADVVVFDAIYGSMTQKILTDLSKEEYVKSKPFVILVDDLFPIDTDKIDLYHKYTFAREAEYEKAVKQIMILSSDIKESSLSAQTPEIETPYQEVTLQELEEDNISIEALLAKLIGEEEKVESIPEISITPEEENPIESQELIEHVGKELQGVNKEPITEEVLSEALRQMEEKLSETVSMAVTNAIQRLDMSFVSDILSSSLYKYLENLNITGIVKDEISKLVSNVDVVAIIREETRKILKEKLEELIK